jgi:ubiquinone/menaquinone biosynthesis C-methylase UbiE
VDLHKGRAEDLPFGDASFDVVLVVTVLCFLADAAGPIQEMARVLVAGGRPVLGELGRFSTWAVWQRLRSWLGSTTWRGDQMPAAVTTLGAAFLTAAARKPRPDQTHGEPS